MGIWYEAMIALARARAVRVTAMTKVAVPRRRDASGAMQDVTVPDHVDILATFGRRRRPICASARSPRSRPPPEAWLFGSEGTLRLEADAAPPLRRPPRRQGARARSPSPPSGGSAGASRRSSSTPSAAREKITRTNFEDGVRYMEFTDAVTKSAASGQAVEVAGL